MSHSPFVVVVRSINAEKSTNEGLDGNQKSLGRSLGSNNNACFQRTALGSPTKPTPNSWAGQAKALINGLIRFASFPLGWRPHFGGRRSIEWGPAPCLGRLDCMDAQCVHLLRESITR